MKYDPTRRRVPLFWRVIPIVFVCALIVITILAYVFSLFIAEFESSRPETVVDHFVESFTAEDAKRLIEENLTEKTGEFMSASDAVQNVIMPLLGDDFSCVKRIGEYTALDPVYTLMAGDRPLARVHFSVVGKTRFGFDLYGDAELEYVASFADIYSENVIIKVPQNAGVYIGSTPLSPSFAPEPEKYSAPAAEFERDTSLLPDYSVYSLGPVFGTPDVSAVMPDGEQLRLLLAEHKEGGYTFTFALPAAVQHSVTVTAPSDAEISIGGIRVSDKYITGSTPYENTGKWNEAAGRQPCEVKYTVTGLVSEAEVTAVMPDGTAISPRKHTDGEYIYDYPYDRLITVQISVPQGGSVTVNGIEAGGSELIDDSAVCAEIAGIDHYITDPERTLLYEISGLYYDPAVEILDASGEKLSVIRTESGAYSYEHETSEALRTEHEDYVISFIENYIKYYTDGSHYINYNYNNYILPYLYRGSEAHQYLSRVYSSLAWTAHVNILEKEIKTYDYRSWGSNCFSCCVDFHLKLDAYEETDQNIEGWEIFFVKTAGGWKIARLILG